MCSLTFLQSTPPWPHPIHLNNLSSLQYSNQTRNLVQTVSCRQPNSSRSSSWWPTRFCWQDTRRLCWQPQRHNLVHLSNSFIRLQAYLHFRLRIHLRRHLSQRPTLSATVPTQLCLQVYRATPFSPDLTQTALNWCLRRWHLPTPYCKHPPISRENCLYPRALKPVPRDPILDNIPKVLGVTTPTAIGEINDPNIRQDWHVFLSRNYFTLMGIQTPKNYCTIFKLFAGLDWLKDKFVLIDWAWLYIHTNTSTPFLFLWNKTRKLRLAVSGINDCQAPLNAFI